MKDLRQRVIRSAQATKLSVDETKGGENGRSLYWVEDEDGVVRAEGG